MSDNWAQLDGGRFLADLYAKDSIQASFLQKIINGINNLGSKLGTNPVGDVQPPPPISNINVSTSGEYLHFNLNHNVPIAKNIQYFAEIDTSPDFPQPQVMDLGSSRSPLPVWLPTLDANGNTNQYYLRAYSQYFGSKPSKITTFGGSLNPASITMGGTTKMSLLPSTGSGTASPTGQQGGSGIGKTAERVAVQPPITKSIAAATVQNAPIVTPSTASQSGSTAISLDATAGATSSSPNTTVSFTHTVSGADILIVCAVLTGTSPSASGHISTVTFDGISFVEATNETVTSTPTGNEYRVEIWYLLNPPSGSFTLSVTTAAAGATWSMNVSSASFFNVNALDSRANASNASTGRPTSNLTNSAANDLVVSAVASDTTITPTFFQPLYEPGTGYKILTTGAGTYMPGWNDNGDAFALAVVSFSPQ